MRKLPTSKAGLKVVVNLPRKRRSVHGNVHTFHEGQAGWSKKRSVTLPYFLDALLSTLIDSIREC